MTQHTAIEITGPYDLREVALMGFGHRDEKSFDGVMRMAFAWTAVTSGPWASPPGRTGTG